VVTRIVVRIIEVIPVWVKLLVGALGATLIGLAVGAHRRLRQRSSDFEQQALHDALTGLPNRVLFGQRVDDALDAVGDSGAQIAVMMIDLDGFKEINDTLGHSSGDLLLELLAMRLSGAIRDDDTVARLGGDEFAVLLHDVPGEVAAASLAVTLRDRLQGLYEINGVSIHTDASIGVAIGPAQGLDPDTLLRHADVAMYSAKERRIGVAVYEPGLDPYSPERLGMVGDLRRALGAGELVLYYQPQVVPTTGRVEAVEALVRWRHPDRGLIEPSEFISLAERTGLIRPLTVWVLEAAIRECASWRRGQIDMRVAVNLSAANLVDIDLPRTIQLMLRRWQVPADALRLEITESTAMADPIRTKAVLTRLDSLGIELAIDDFGTGYSSLSYLRSLPVRELKIDRSFVSRMMVDGNDHAIVVATIDLAHTLGLRVVAEGVEDTETLLELMRNGCDLVQGYRIARPLPVRELQAWLASWPVATRGGLPKLPHIAPSSAALTAG
jgi:diguanylate cyclase